MPSKRGRKLSRAGFTLVELLMTMAIIGVLANIAISQFTLYKQRAYDSMAKSDISNFRNAVVNASTAASFVTLQSGPTTHPNFTEVPISIGVHIMTVSWDFGTGPVFYAYACHVNGQQGFFMLVPYGATNPFAWLNPNELYQSAAYRFIC